MEATEDLVEWGFIDRGNGRFSLVHYKPFCKAIDTIRPEYCSHRYISEKQCCAFECAKPFPEEMITQWKLLQNY